MNEASKDSVWWTSEEYKNDTNLALKKLGLT